MNMFETYTTLPRAISFARMQSIHGEILAEVGGDPEAEELYEALLDTATKYAAIRAAWNGLTLKEKTKLDPGRTLCHDSLITHFNMLARYLRMQGKAAAWRDALGYQEEDRYNRKAIGDFGCYLVFVNSLLAR